MRIAVVWVLLLGGCRWILGIDGSTPSQDAAIDAAIDPFQDAPGTGIDASPGAKCYGPVGVWNVCLGTAPTGSINLTGTLDTDHDSRCLGAQPVGWYPAQPSSCFIVGGSITIPAGNMLRVTGSKPLVLVADSLVAIAGTLDIASHGNERGAGADPSACPPFAISPSGGPHGAGGGGAGGTFMTMGGSGGDGDIGHGRGGVASSGGAMPTALRGGCAGQRGFGAMAGAARAGGGALYVVSGQTIDIEGTIDASGAGGRASSVVGAGGDGGGAGGMVVLYATAITAVTVFANGGGGAGGSGTTPNRLGTDGTDPAVFDNPAPGGNGSAPGGRGFAVNHDANKGGSAGTGDGGGGGGGGAGLVLSNVALSGNISPAPMHF